MFFEKSEEQGAFARAVTDGDQHMQARLGLWRVTINLAPGPSHFSQDGDRNAEEAMATGEAEPGRGEEIAVSSLRMGGATRALIQCTCPWSELNSPVGSLNPILLKGSLGFKPDVAHRLPLPLPGYDQHL